jgi:hypothetical protein
VRDFERGGASFSIVNCRRNAERFSVARFQREFQSFVSAAWAEHERTHATHAAA